MKFEIVIQGPKDMLHALCRELREDRAPEPANRPPGDSRTDPLGRIRMEASEENVNDRLETLSRAADRVEGRFHAKGAFSFRAFNRAYAEPSAGGDRPRSSFRPVPSLLIQPWYTGLDLHAMPPENLVLDPAHAFGTGRHPTTRMCLACLEGMAPDDLKGSRVLDFGCGTAVLALAAVRMGAREALGVERDPAAARAARRNISLNGLDSRVRVRTGSWEVVEGAYDLILANLVPAALLRTGDRMRQHLRSAGKVVISGFGRARMDEVEAFFSATGLLPDQRMDLEGWGALVMARADGADPARRPRGSSEGPGAGDNP